jgi:hypothetical protein
MHVKIAPFSEADLEEASELLARHQPALLALLAATRLPPGCLSPLTPPG